MKRKITGNGSFFSKKSSSTATTSNCTTTDRFPHTLLLPELWSLIAQYSIRCEFCFSHFLKNGRCLTCPQKKLNDEEDYDFITYQMIPDHERPGLEMKLIDVSLFEYNFDKKLQKRSLANEISSQEETYDTCNSTFIVFRMLKDATTGVLFLLLSQCLDDNNCHRQSNEHVGVFICNQHWRKMTIEELGTVFGDTFNWGWSDWRSDEEAFKSFQKYYSR
jgi:hypothetical protein